MSLADMNLDAVTETDLLRLIADGVQEGSRIEYKRTSYGGSDNDKREFLKDATSFANAFGGHLILGIDAVDGVASKVAPIAGSADAEVLRLESLMRDAVEPRIAGIQMRAVPVSGGGVVIVIRVPRSWNAPHRVIFKGLGRFYGRSSAGTYELAVEELRSKFGASLTAFERAAAFRERRLALAAADEGTVTLAKADGWLAVHIFPLATTGEAIVDLEAAAAKADLLRPIGPDGWSSEFNYDGFANIRSGAQSFGYTQLFRDGSIEATKVRIIAETQGVWRIPAMTFGTPIVKAVSDYIAALQALGVSPPFSVMITLDGVRGAYLGYSQSQWLDDPAVFRQNRLLLPPVIISDYSTPQSYQASLRPAFDALWNAGGLSKCTYFTDDGRWQPHN